MANWQRVEILYDEEIVLLWLPLRDWFHLELDFETKLQIENGLKSVSTILWIIDLWFNKFSFPNFWNEWNCDCQMFSRILSTILSYNKSLHQCCFYIFYFKKHFAIFDASFQNLSEIFREKFKCLFGYLMPIDKVGD